MKSRATAASIRRTGILFVALVTLMLLGGCRNRAGEKEQPESQTKEGAAQITVENGQTMITLDPATQKRLGFTVATLTSTVTRAQAAFPVVVVGVEGLAAFRSTYVAAQAQLEGRRLQAGVADKEYARLKTLFGENQNISEKSLQSAEATLQSDQADVRAAEQQLNLQASSLQQQWGEVVTRWATEDSQPFQRVVNGGQALVQMTMPSGTTFAPPRTISLEIPSGSRTQARFVSPFPRVDPRVQGRSFLYLASGRPELPPGLTLVARLPVGGSLKGVVIPAAAVVWSEGKAWVYSQVSANSFRRSPVSTDVPVDHGYFAAEGFSAGDKVVTVGAQDLLSEEMLLHSQGGGDED